MTQEQMEIESITLPERILVGKKYYYLEGNKINATDIKGKIIEKHTLAYLNNGIIAHAEYSLNGRDSTSEFFGIMDDTKEQCVSQMKHVVYRHKKLVENGYTIKETGTRYHFGKKDSKKKKKASKGILSAATLTVKSN